MDRTGHRHFFVHELGLIEPKCKVWRIKVAGGETPLGGIEGLRVSFFHFFSEIVDLVLLKERVVGQPLLRLEIEPDAVAHRGGFRLDQFRHAGDIADRITPHPGHDHIGFLIEYQGWCCQGYVREFHLRFSVQQDPARIHIQYHGILCLILHRRIKGVGRQFNIQRVYR